MVSFSGIVPSFLNFSSASNAGIIRLIETLCADGLALLVISSELEELVGYADRVIIMRDRKQVAEIPLAELSVPAIMNAIAA